MHWELEAHALKAIDAIQFATRSLHGTPTHFARWLFKGFQVLLAPPPPSPPPPPPSRPAAAAVAAANPAAIKGRHPVGFIEEVRNGFEHSNS